VSRRSARILEEALQVAQLGPPPASEQTNDDRSEQALRPAEVDLAPARQAGGSADPLEEEAAGRTPDEGDRRFDRKDVTRVVFGHDDRLRSDLTPEDRTHTLDRRADPQGSGGRLAQLAAAARPSRRVLEVDDEFPDIRYGPIDDRVDLDPQDGAASVP
jgi:hypothetical protein